MVRTGQPVEQFAIRGLAYRSARHAGLPVEVIRRDDLRERMGDAFFRSPERLDFNLVVLCTGGAGAHEVDFVRVALAQGSLLLIGPGQVHRFIWEGTLAATLVVYPPQSSTDASGVGVRAQHMRLDAGEAQLLGDDIASIAGEQARCGGSRGHAALLRAQLQVVLARIAMSSARIMQASADTPIYDAFAAALEAHYATTRRAQSYAVQVGCSARTLHRACEQAAGRSAKELVDARVALEAKRLLAGTDATVEEIAGRLGFSEATNFVKFFRRLERTTPSEFRERHR